MSKKIPAGLVLASASPRRRELLLQLMPGIKLHILPADLDESLITSETGTARVLRLAEAKAAAVKTSLPKEFANYPILAADTEVVLKGVPLGKPESFDHAVALLEQLSGCSHQVITAVHLQEDKQAQQAVITTEVSFKSLTKDEIVAYVATGEPMDKAGGYGIQGLGAAFVTSIQGSYSNVVGLPLETVYLQLRQLGYTVI
ncbi:Maf family protein [Marinospirillum insulare]|uniref:dTTP/UTP pyrophosphatase n=1 Tax=Marinospirillum insulare TaxID=217169 RepID=A0ABQ6A1J6_9GAMM|nr:Maf family protein [Marinospirillum insulare]GLR65172.1 Maf-like protein [Marinospirillum insulare]